MKIMDSFRAGGSFLSFMPWIMDDIILMGHDGPGHIAIAEGKTKSASIEWLTHGKVSKGLSVEMQVKHGPVTLLSVGKKLVGP